MPFCPGVNVRDKVKIDAEPFEATRKCEQRENSERRCCCWVISALRPGNVRFGHTYTFSPVKVDGIRLFELNAGPSELEDYTNEEVHVLERTEHGLNWNKLGEVSVPRYPVHARQTEKSFDYSGTIVAVVIGSTWSPIDHSALKLRNPKWKYKVNVLNKHTGETLLNREVMITPGFTQRMQYSFQMPYEDVEVTKTIKKQTRNGWKTTRSRDKVYRVNPPVFPSIQNTQIPDKARPGESINASINIRNTGECSGRCRIRGKISGESFISQSFNLSDSRGFNPTIKVPGLLNPTVTVSVETKRPTGWVQTDNVRKQLDSIEGMFLYNNSINIATGNNATKYAMLVQADKISVPESETVVKEGDENFVLELGNILPISEAREKIAIIKGKISPNSITTIGASDPSYLRCLLTRPLVWCPKGDVEEKTKNIKYGSPLATMQTEARYPDITNILKKQIKTI